jgi:hypothetical protein
VRNIFFLISRGLPFTAFARGLFDLLQVCLLLDSKTFRGKFTLTQGSKAFAYYLHSLCFLLSTHLASRHLLSLVIFQPRRYLFFSHEWILVKLLRLLLVNPADEQKRQDQKTAPVCLLSTLKRLRGAPNTILDI